jgi:hypothetical protein
MSAGCFSTLCNNPLGKWAVQLSSPCPPLFLLLLGASPSLP